MIVIETSFRVQDGMAASEARGSFGSKVLKGIRKIYFLGA
jgi:hypothetical protein